MLRRTEVAGVCSPQKRLEQIRRWGEETREKLCIKDEDDVDGIIHEFRQERFKCKE